MIIRIGNAIFHEYYVAFHCIRKNVYCPWVPIGVYVSYGNRSACRYAHEYRHMIDEYQEEVDKAGSLCGTYEFLDEWRKHHVDTNSVISKIIKYCSTSTHFEAIIEALFWFFGNNPTIENIKKLTIMLKNRDRYFPVVYTSTGKKNKLVKEELRKAGII